MAVFPPFPQPLPPEPIHTRSLEPFSIRNTKKRELNGDKDLNNNERGRNKWKAIV